MDIPWRGWKDIALRLYTSFFDDRVMLIAAGCFRPPKIIDPEITNDRFVLWIGSDDPNFEKARAFMEELDPVEIRDVRFDS